MQIRFQTRSGTASSRRGLYSYNKHKAFNSNAFSRVWPACRNRRPRASCAAAASAVRSLFPVSTTAEARPFFFFNQEESYSPSQTQRTRTLIRQSALNGDFTYNNTTPTTVNLLQLAAANGQLSTYDPVIKTLLEQMRTAAGTTGSITDVATSPNTSSYAWFVDVKSIRHAPTTNITFNLTPKHRLQGSSCWQRFSDTPDTLNSDPSYGIPTFRRSGSFARRRR